MKSPNSPARMSLEQLEAQTRREKRKMLVMGLAAVLLLGAYLYSRYSSEQRGEETAQQENGELPQDRGARVDEVVLAFPPFADEDRAVLDEVRDGTPEERILVHEPALHMLLIYGALLTPEHYRDAARLDPATREALAAEPDAHRMDLLEGRGEVLQLRRHRRPTATFDEYRGSLRQQDGSYVHFVVAKDPAEESLAVGDFVVLRGVFLQQYDVELEGAWRTGPLVLGRELSASVPALDLTQEVPLEALYAVQDDDGQTTLEQEPEQATWELMSLAAQGREDWSQAPELTAPVLNLIFENPELYRGKPFTFPISRNLDGWTERVGENPLRLRERTVGWIGNQTWHGKVVMVKWVGPFAKPSLQDRYGDAFYVTGKGYFLRNHNYEDRNGLPRRCPVFVMADVEPFVPVPDRSAANLMWYMLGGTLLLVGLIYMLLTRDKKQSEKLQEELLRRRRERRQRTTQEDVANSGAAGH